MIADRNHQAVKAALKYAGDYPSKHFRVRETTWKWDDNDTPIHLGGGEGNSPTNNYSPNCLEMHFYPSSPYGPHSGFNPEFQEMRWNAKKGELTIRGETNGRRYTCLLVFEPKS